MEDFEPTTTRKTLDIASTNFLIMPAEVLSTSEQLVHFKFRLKYGTGEDLPKDKISGFKLRDRNFFIHAESSSIFTLEKSDFR